VLRACHRRLKPGGRLAFYTIFAAPGLSEAEYRRARRSGPSHLSTGRLDQGELIASAGLQLLEEHDLTPQFLKTARAWYDGRRRYEAELRQSDGDAVFEERQRDSMTQIRAIEAGLLRRALFVATRP
jgi:cyclopropane fatty-acyl-phospholipid synthase-like methyltransferase